MADLLALALRYLHIVFGVAWIGAVFYSVAVLRTAMGRVDMDARRKTMKALLPVAIHYVPIAAVLTIVFGALLYAHLGAYSLDYMLSSTWGQTIFGAMVLTLVTFGLGMFLVVGGSRKIAVHLAEETCTHATEVGTLQERTNLGQLTVLVLGMVLLALMVSA